MLITLDPFNVEALRSWLDGASAPDDGLTIQDAGNGSLILDMGLASCEITAEGTVLPS